MNLRRFFRSPAEIRFRLSQESWNIRAFLSPPRIPNLPATLPRLFPAPEPLLSVAAPGWRTGVLTLADRICAGELPLLGTSIHFDPHNVSPEDWRRDFIGGKSSEPTYFRRLPYLDAQAVGDHKVIWELNRHQHLVVLAQAALLEPADLRWTKALEASLDSWFRGNPLHRGINWASALEVAFRALSWMWILHFAADRLSPALHRRLIEGLYLHALHLEHNLSIYFAPNTHLLGEAVCLHALGRLFAPLPAAARWQELGSTWVQRAMQAQVLADGAHFEQSSYYHVYALDFFLLHALLAPVSDEYHQRVRQMCTWLTRIVDRDGVMPLFGDDDGGRLFHPYGPRRGFPRATLSAASVYYSEPAWCFAPEDYAKTGLWWLGPAPEDFCPGNFQPRNGVSRESGVAALGDRDTRLLLLGRAFSRGQAGHSHAHALHVLLQHAGEDLLIDSGTYTYVGDPVQRDQFRAASAHNVFRIDGDNQATPINAFLWSAERGQGRIEDAGESTATASYQPASGTYRLSRTVTWNPGEVLFLDSAEAEGVRLVEQFWHVPIEAAWDAESRCLRWPCGAQLWPDPQLQADLLESQYSEALYQKSPARCLRLWGEIALPARFTTRIVVAPQRHPTENTLFLPI